MAMILDGKKARDFYKTMLIERAKRLSRAPALGLIQVGDNKESSLYIEQKKKFAKSIGARVEHLTFSTDAAEMDIEKKISELNGNNGIDGIIIQLPLPAGFDKERLINTIDPKKDVDGLTDENQRLLEGGRPRFIPATPLGISKLLQFYEIDLVGKHAAVMGRSRLVGGPLAHVLKKMGTSVDVCHSKTIDPKSITKAADALFVAIGKPALVDSSYVKEGAIVVDIGINSTTGDKLEEEIPKRKVIGDVNFEDVSPKARAISPVPGGVGPMTVLSLFANLIDSAEHNADK